MTDENVTPISVGKPLARHAKDGEVEPVDVLPELRAKATPLIKTASELDAAHKPADGSKLSKLGQKAPAPIPPIALDQRLASIEAKLDKILAALTTDV